MILEHEWHYARAWLFHFLGLDEHAYATFATVLALDAGNVQATRHLAGIAAARQRWEIAGDWYEKVTTLAPEDAGAWFNLGFVRERHSKPEAALLAFNEAVRLKPGLDRAWHGMGLAHARLGQHSAAAAALEQAVALQPFNGESFYQLGMAYHHAGQAEAVKRVVARLVGFEPKRAEALVQDAGRGDLAYLIPELPF